MEYTNDLPSRLPGYVFSSDYSRSRIRKSIIVTMRAQGLTWKRIGQCFGITGSAAAGIAKTDRIEAHNPNQLHDIDVRLLGRHADQLNAMWPR